MLADRVALDHAVLGNRVDLNLLGALKELGHHDRMLLAHDGRILERVLKLVHVLHNPHRSARKHI